MNLVDIIVHLLNFLAAPLVVSALVWAAARWRSQAHMRQGFAFATIFIAACAASVLGWVYFGNDGKMLSYALMCAASAGAALMVFRLRGKV